jgi:predicted DNA-binding transcriptional regulator AlpA
MNATGNTPEQFDELPDESFIRQAALLRIIPFSAPTLWRRVKDQQFPSPAKLSDGVTAWHVGSIRQWMRKRLNESAKGDC